MSADIFFNKNAQGNQEFTTQRKGCLLFFGSQKARLLFSSKCGTRQHSIYIETIKSEIFLNQLFFFVMADLVMMSAIFPAKVTVFCLREYQTSK